MDQSSRRIIKRRLAGAASLAAAAVLLAILYLVSVLLQGTPRALNLADALLDGLFFEGQNPRSLLLSLDLTEGRAVAGRAAVTLGGDSGGRAVYFLLNSNLSVIEAAWNGVPLAPAQRLGPLCRVAIPAGAGESREGTLEIAYRGTLQLPEACSLFSADFIYLDPDDCYYPRFSAAAVAVSVSATFPAGFQQVAAAGSPQAGGAGSAAFAWTLTEPVSTFAVAACRREAVKVEFGDLTASLFFLGRERAIARESILALCAFLHDRLPAFQPKALQIVVVPAGLAARMRYDGAETVLFPEQQRINDLAFALALVWIPDRKEQRSLFSKEELAMGFSLYYMAESSRLERSYLACLAQLDLFGGISCMPRPRLAATFFPGASVVGRVRPAGYDAGFGGCLLAVLRRFVGNEAFDRICREALAAAPGDDGREFWLERCQASGAAGCRWFIEEFAGPRRRLDLAVKAVEVWSLPERGGRRVRCVIENRGDLDLPEKVQVVLITKERWLMSRVLVPRGGASWESPLLEEDLLAVMVDPDYEWPDADRTNNLAFLDPHPSMIMPSADNRYLAVAFRREAVGGLRPLMIENLDGRGRTVLPLRAPVAGLEWIDRERLLVTTSRQRPHSGAAGRGTNHYLVDARAGGLKHLGQDLIVSPSPSGNYLLVNERRGDRWCHRLVDLRERTETPILNRIFDQLEFIRGTDLIKVVESSRAAWRTNLYTPDGIAAFTDVRTGDASLFDFEGYGGGIFFLGRRDERTRFYHLARPGAEAKPLLTFAERDITFRLSPAEGCVYFFERGDPSLSFLVTRYDIEGSSPGRKLLYEGDSAVPPNLMTAKGFVKLAAGGSRLAFQSFEDGVETEIAAGQAGLRPIALVGEPGSRSLYFAKEEPLAHTPARWAGMSTYMRPVFYRFDFGSGATRPAVGEGAER